MVKSKIGAFVGLAGLLLGACRAGLVPEYGFAGPRLELGAGGGGGGGLAYGGGGGYGGGFGPVAVQQAGGLPLYGAGARLVQQQIAPYAGYGAVPFAAAKPVIEPLYQQQQPLYAQQQPLLHQQHLAHGYGGEEVDKTVFGGGKKALTGEHYEKLGGKKGEEFHHGDGGFHEGKTLAKDVKGDSAYYGDVAEGKKVAEDAKLYHGGQHFGKEGKTGEEKKVAHGHKKGRVVKGYKNSHHKDETGHAEEYYDENHDEGGESAFGGNFGSFGETGSSNFKGGHEDGQLYANEHKKSGHYDNEHLVDRSGADHGKYGTSRFHGNDAVYGRNNGIDEHSLQGHRESERVLKHHPLYSHQFY